MRSDFATKVLRLARDKVNDHKTGLGDGEDQLLQTLQVLGTDYDELTKAGRKKEAMQLESFVINNLARRLQVERLFNNNKDLRDVKIPPIVMIFSLPRSGSTLLHHLLALDSNSRSLRKWELTIPFPPPIRETYDHDPRIMVVQQRLDRLKGSVAVSQMHWVDADEPDENTLAFLDCTGLAAVGGLQGIANNWYEYIHDRTRCDRVKSFQSLRKMLQFYCWKVPPKSHLVLKCPMTSMFWKEFIQVFPETRAVLLHRDPLRVSLSGLTMTSMIGGGADLEDIQDFRETLKYNMMSYDAFTTYKPPSSIPMTNVMYETMLDDPLQTVLDIYQALDLNPSSDLQDKIANFLKMQREGKRVKPPNKLPVPPTVQKQCTHVVNTDPVIQKYVRTFSIPQEIERRFDVSASKL